MFPKHEGSMSIVVMRDDAAPSGSMTGSRMEGNHRNTYVDVYGARPIATTGLIRIDGHNC